MKAKVCQVYREALQEAIKGFRDPDQREGMVQLVKDEFRVFRRDPEQLDWELDSELIDYNLALIRKQINMIKDLRDRVK